jgi:hypothetical protein
LIGTAILYDTADADEQPVCITGHGSRIRAYKYGAKQIEEGKPHVGAGRCGYAFPASDAVKNKLTEEARCDGSAAPV